MNASEKVRETARADARTSPEGSAKAEKHPVAAQDVPKGLDNSEEHRATFPAADIPKSISAPQGFDTHVGSWKRTTFLVVAARLRKGDFGEIEMAKHD